MNCDEGRISLGATARNPDQVRTLHGLGLQYAEIPITDPESFGEMVDPYRRVKKELKFYYLCHGPQEGDPNDRHSLERGYLPRLMAVLPLMAELEMHLLSVHLWLDPRFVKQEVIRFKIDLLREFTAEASLRGITVCLENLSEQAGHLGEVFEAIPLLRLTLDLGHAQLLSEVNTGYAFLERYPERIRHIHAHDNRGGDSPLEDLHLPLGEGIVPFDALFRRILETHYEGTITLELKPHEIASSLERLRRFLRPNGEEGG